MAEIAYPRKAPQEPLLQQALVSSIRTKTVPLADLPQSAALKPVQLATSPTAIKSYLSAILFLTTSLVLLSLSTVAYMFLYYSYIPQINLSHTIYFQYGAGSHPFAITPLDPSALVSQQPYDVSVHLHLPNTPTNLNAGNFMLDLALLTTPANPISSTTTSLLPNATTPGPYTVLATSRRPAILPFSSPILSLTSTFINLPWHLLSFRDLDSTHLTIPMFERTSFARGSSAQNVPRAIRVELQSDHILQVYTAKVEFVARFEGLRYILYNYRIICYLLFSTIFYTVTIASMATAWLVFSASFSRPLDTKPDQRRIKVEQNQDTAQQSNGTPVRPSQSSPSTQDLNRRLKEEPSSSDSDQGLSITTLSDPSSAVLPPALSTNGRQMPLRMPLRRNTPSSTSSVTGAGSASGRTTGPSSIPRPNPSSWTSPTNANSLPEAASQAYAAAVRLGTRGGGHDEPDDEIEEVEDAQRARAAHPCPEQDGARGQEHHDAARDRDEDSAIADMSIKSE